MSAENKAAALDRGRRTRRPEGPPSATPLPPPEPATEDQGAVERPATPGRAPSGQGRRGHLRKMSLELTPDDHNRLKVWLVTAFGGDAKATPVIKALLAEAYADPALTDRVRRRLKSRD